MRISLGAVVGRMTFIFRSIYFSLSVSPLDLFPIFDVGSVAGEGGNGVQMVINLYYVYRNVIHSNEIIDKYEQSNLCVCSRYS